MFLNTILRHSEKLFEKYWGINVCIYDDFVIINYCKMDWECGVYM